MLANSSTTLPLLLLDDITCIADKVTIQHETQSEKMRAMDGDSIDVTYSRSVEVQFKPRNNVRSELLDSVGRSVNAFVVNDDNVIELHDAIIQMESQSSYTILANQKSVIGLEQY